MPEPDFKENFYNFPTTSGSLLRMKLAERGLDQTKLAELIGVSRATINNVINDKYDISKSMADKLSDIFKTSPAFWINLKNNDVIDNEKRYDNSLIPGLLTHGRIVNSIQNNHIIIDGFSLENDTHLIQDTSLDMRLDSMVFKNDGKEINIPKNGTFLLAPGEQILARTYEKLDMPHDVSGRFGGMGKYTRQFISYSHGGVIDPGYDGHLDFLIENKGTKKFAIRCMMPIVTATFEKLNQTTEGYQTPLHDPHGGVRNSVSELEILHHISKRIISDFTRGEQEGTSNYELESAGVFLQYSSSLDKNELIELFTDEVRVMINSYKLSGRPISDSKIDRYISGLNLPNSITNSNIGFGEYAENQKNHTASEFFLELQSI